MGFHGANYGLLGIERLDSKLSGFCILHTIIPHFAFRILLSAFCILPTGVSNMRADMPTDPHQAGQTHN